MAPSDARLDALLPSEMAAKASDVGARKAAAGLLPTFVLAVLAGAFVALGAAFATTVAAGSAGIVPYGFVRVAAGLAFSLGLILVIVGGAELFTGNNLLAMAWASRRITLGIGRAQLGDRLRGQPRRGARDRGAGGRLGAVPVRRRRGRRGRACPPR